MLGFVFDLIPPCLPLSGGRDFLCQHAQRGELLTIEEELSQFRRKKLVDFSVGKLAEGGLQETVQRLLELRRPHARTQRGAYGPSPTVAHGLPLRPVPNLRRLLPTKEKNKMHWLVEWKRAQLVAR